jgi:ParB family chromosome partitioning protein
MEIVQIPLDAIDEAALARDRTLLDEEAMHELRLSIAANGLRMPIELFERAHPEPPRLYGLISGLRRLSAFRSLLELTGQERYRTIPAFVRSPNSLAQALAAMVEENEIRTELSPWERGRIAAMAVRREIFPTIEAAVAELYPAADRTKRTRLRNLAHAAQELDGWLTEPERLSQRQALRLAAACNAGLGPVIRTALEESKTEQPEAQWRLIEPILLESERLPADAPRPPTLPGWRERPRRVLRPRPGLTMRREQTRDGWCLHLTGSLATSDFCDEIFDEIERRFAPADDLTTGLMRTPVVLTDQ